MNFQAQPVTRNSVPTYDLTSNTPGVTIVLNTAQPSRALTTRIPLNDAFTSSSSPAPPALSTFHQQRFLKSLPDPLVSPMVNPSNTFLGTGADLSSFEDEDGSTDDGIGSVPAEERAPDFESGNVRSNDREHITPYYRMPFNCPTLPTVPCAVLGDSTAPIQSSPVDINRREQEVVVVNEIQTVSSPVEDTEALPECICCHHSITNKSAIIDTDCMHHYDLECFERLLTLSLKSTSLPTCCGQYIPARRFLHLISPGLKRLYLTKEVEMMVDEGDRLYCPWTDCAVFVGPINEDPEDEEGMGDDKSEDRRVMCPKCSREICTRCRSEAHDTPHPVTNSTDAGVGTNLRRERTHTRQPSLPPTVHFRSPSVPARSSSGPSYQRGFGTRSLSRSAANRGVTGPGTGPGTRAARSPSCNPSYPNPSDREDMEVVLRVGRKRGWQRCYQCRTMVEILEGCNHITCRCSAEFCYRCGMPWKPRSCDCGVFSSPSTNQ